MFYHNIVVSTTMLCRQYEITTFLYHNDITLFCC